MMRPPWITDRLFPRWVAVVGAFSLASAPAEARAEAFEDAVRTARFSVVSVVDDSGSTLCLGTVIAPSHVVAKASCLRGEDSVKVAAGHDRLLDVTLRHVDQENDLAFLRVATSPGNPCITVTGDAVEKLAPGRVVIAVTSQIAPPLIGAVGAVERAIPLRNGVLGVKLDPWFRGSGTRIDQVHNGGGAEAAGLKDRDVIVNADGVTVRNSEELQRVVFAHLPGDVIPVVVRREGESITVDVTLAHMSVNDVHHPLTKRNAEVSGRTSRRKSGFSRVIQHDITLAPEEMGSPLLDVAGDLVGINIARVDRVTTFALHAAAVKASYQAFVAKTHPFETPPVDTNPSKPSKDGSRGEPGTR